MFKIFMMVDGSFSRLITRMITDDSQVENEFAKYHRLSISSISLSLAPGGGKRRDPGNEVAYEVPDLWFLVKFNEGLYLENAL